MERRKTDSDKVLISVQMTVEERKMLKLLALEYDTSASELIRNWLYEAKKKYDKEKQ